MAVTLETCEKRNGYPSSCEELDVSVLLARSPWTIHHEQAAISKVGAKPSDLRWARRSFSARMVIGFVDSPLLAVPGEPQSIDGSPVVPRVYVPSMRKSVSPGLSNLLPFSTLPNVRQGLLAEVPEFESRSEEHTSELQSQSNLVC